MVICRSRRGLILLLVMMLPGVGGCTMSVQQEIELGRQSHEKFEREFGGVYPDQEVQQYVNRVGLDMARYAGRPRMVWQFRVLNSDQINAFAVPGGYIYITRGLLFHLNNEAQLAGVLGHESGHIAHRDSVHQIQQAQLLQGGVLLAGIFGGDTAGDIAGVVASLGLLKYTRDQEKSADLAGLQYMTQAGYNPRGMVQLMRILQQAGGDGGPQFLSTHPDPGNRIEYLTETINEKYRMAAQNGQFDGPDFRRHVLDETSARKSPPQPSAGVPGEGK